jgi:NAD(P)-dependent dehydrogenase (short-subunit alcohol dehydrogenase family)
MNETSVSSVRKVVVITGASRGMGAALVEAYRERDYRVAAMARSIESTNDDQVLAEMEKHHSGHVVQITMSLVEHANAHVSSVLSSLTKGGSSAATKSLAIEYAKRDTTVNAVTPGVIKTPMHPAETCAQLPKLYPLGRMGTFSEIVDAILYLESAEFVTRDTMHVDRGQSARR